MPILGRKDVGKLKVYLLFVEYEGDTVPSDEDDGEFLGPAILQMVKHKSVKHVEIGPYVSGLKE